MNTREFDALLTETLNDERLSRAERKDVASWLDAMGASPDARAQARSRAFAIAAEGVTDPAARARLSWLEGVVKATVPKAPAGSSGSNIAVAVFSPGEECLQQISSFIRNTRRSLDICVFTITDDRISSQIVEAHKRGVAVRVITDDDKSLDRGSDIARLDTRGVNVRVDRTRHHMHHKYAISDGELLLTGSYNWTRSAASYNEENIVVTNERRLVEAFGENFEGLWASLG